LSGTNPLIPDMSLKRWMSAPNNSGQIQPGQLTGVFLGKGENVRWSWAFGSDGSQIVTGYQIVTKKKTSATRPKAGKTKDVTGIVGSWKDERSADEIVKDIYSSRRSKKSSVFELFGTAKSKVTDGSVNHDKYIYDTQ